MRSKLVLFLFLIQVLGQSLLAQDILFTANLEDERLNKLYSLLRNVWIQQTGKDPLNQEINEVIEFNLTETFRSLSVDTQSWVHDFQQLVKLDLLGSDLLLKITKPKFQLGDQFSSIQPFYDSNRNLHFQGKHFLKGLMLSANSIELLIKIPRVQQKPLELKIDLLKPKIELINKLNSSLETEWLTKFDPQQLFIEVEKLSVVDVIKEVHKNPELLEMSFEDLIVPKVEIEIGRRVIKFDQVKIAQFTKNRLNQLKKLILELIIQKYENGLGNIVIDKKPSINIKRDQLYQSEKFAVATRLMDITSESNVNKEVSLGFNVNFCPLEMKQILSASQCSANRILSSGSVNKLVKLKTDEVMPEKDEDLHVQIKEKLINELLSTSIKINMWDEVLEEENLTWGEYGAFLHTNKAGKNFDLYLDLFHQLGKKDAFFTGRKKIHFPVKLKVQLKIEKDANQAHHLRLVVKELFNDDEVLLSGYPELNLESDVGSVPRFKKKLLEKLQTKLEKFRGKTLMDFKLPELSDTLLNQVIFTSDDEGTLQGYFDLRAKDN